MAAGLHAFFVALIASLLLVVPERALALRVGMVDLPGPRKDHLRPIPLLGGLAMYGAVMIAVLFVFDGPARAQIEGILAGASLVAAVGILDDRGWLHHQVKLFIGMPLAAVILLIKFPAFTRKFSASWLGGRSGYIFDAILTVVWVVGITASFSIVDHMDGLCAGIAAVASVSFAIIAYLNGQTFVATLAAAVLGAATGFLRWNFKPAKIFMGDGGAMFLGIPDGQILALEVAPGKRRATRRLARTGFDPVGVITIFITCHACHYFQGTPGIAALCNTGERPRRSSLVQPGSRPSRLGALALSPRRIQRGYRLAGQLIFLRRAPPSLASSLSHSFSPAWLTWNAPPTNANARPSLPQKNHRWNQFAD